MMFVSRTISFGLVFSRHFRKPKLQFVLVKIFGVHIFEIFVMFYITGLKFRGCDEREKIRLKLVVLPNIFQKQAQTIDVMNKHVHLFGGINGRILKLV